MHQTLALHPDSRCNAVIRIDVEATRPRPGHLVLRYTVAGKIADLRLPRPTPIRAHRRALEAHLLRGLPPPAVGRRPTASSTSRRRRSGPPTAFRGYRNGMRWPTRSARRSSSVQSAADSTSCSLGSTCERLARTCGALAPRPLGGDRGRERRQILLGASASAGKPDFHHADGFALELPSAEPIMKFGIDRLLAEPTLRAPLKGQRVALLAHPGVRHARSDAFARRARRAAATSSSPPPSARSTACAATSRTT